MSAAETAGVLPAWRACTESVALDVRVRVAKSVSEAAHPLADTFYAAMLADPQAARIVDHALVARRLHAAMVAWMRELFAVEASVEEKIAVQRATGQIHARIGVPMELVHRGARVLRHAITEDLLRSELDRGALVSAVRYVFELVDLAIESMSETFAKDASRSARSDEAYRLFVLGQNMKAERERQRSQLLEWANGILMRYFGQGPGGDAADDVRPAERSQFGLWLQHKASILFEEAGEIDEIRLHVSAIEDDLLERLGRARAKPAEAGAVVAEINRRVDAIKGLLGTMFDRFIEAEDGRDSVTRLLNRRFFPSVVRREMALAQRGGNPFALLRLDLDHFAELRDVLGLDASDLVLSQIADLLLDSVRAGDFVFRIGDEQFLVLLVESSQPVAMTIAEALRVQFETSPLRTPDHGPTTVTISVGVARFDGHPDYQRLLDRAEAALRRAQEAGRNRCEATD